MGRNRLLYLYEVSIEESEDVIKYPEGIKMRMALFRLSSKDQDRELIELIDNHPPYGVHIHNRLPQDHSSRSGIDGDWESILKLFNSIARRYK